MGYSMQGMKKPTTTTSVPAPTSTPYKAPVAPVTFTSTPKATALMKKTGKAVPKGYLKTNVK